jgi:hypothetical protein
MSLDFISFAKRDSCLSLEKRELTFSASLFFLFLFFQKEKNALLLVFYFSFSKAK